MAFNLFTGVLADLGAYYFNEILTIYSNAPTIPVGTIAARFYEGDMNKTTVGALALVALAAGPAAAAESYFGFALENGYAKSKSTSLGFDGESTATIPSLSLIFGRTYDVETFFWGFEGSATYSSNHELASNGVKCSSFATAPYMCEQKGVVRLSAVLGKDLGKFDIYGKLGYGVAFGDFATDTFSKESGSVGGVTVALGGATEFKDLGKIFAELVVDDFSSSSSQSNGFTSEYETVGLRVGFLKSF